MEHPCINKTSKFETDFLEKKRQQFLWLLNSLGGPLDILCFGISMEFFCTFFPDLHFSMQTHSLVEHIYALFEKWRLRIISVSWESQNSLKVVFKNSTTILTVLLKDFSPKGYIIYVLTCVKDLFHL